jgi:DNA-binding NarL/FixJ family response regulator
MMTACCVTKERCSKDVDIRCSLPPPPDKALQIAAVCAIAAVIVDYHMPEMNGHEVASEIKRLKPQVPIVMVSSDDGIPEPALSVVDAFVSKNRKTQPLVAGDRSNLRRKPLRVPRNQNQLMPGALKELDR